MAKTDTLFMTKTAENPTLWGLTYLYSPYNGETPLHRAEAIDGAGNVVLMLCSVRKTICGYVNLAYVPHFSLKRNQGRTYQLTLYSEQLHDIQENKIANASIAGFHMTSLKFKLQNY